MIEPRIALPGPVKVESSFGTNLVDDINRLVNKTKFELVIMAYNLNLNTDFVLLQAIKNRLISTNPESNYFVIIALLRIHSWNYSTIGEII